jgi:hypothetical protein
MAPARSATPCSGWRHHWPPRITINGAGGNHVESVALLFGDADRDGQDREAFRAAHESGTDTYLWYFDFDADGDVDGHDNGQFNRRFGQS